MTSLYSLHSITQRYGEREVLHIDTLEIEAGEIYALLGANGAGKTTLMRILAFLDAPAGGDMHFKGEKIPLGKHAFFRPGVVWVSQFPTMFTGSLAYNIEYPMALKGIPAPKRRARTQELLEELNLAHLAKAPAPRLSGGEAQRASIARAMAAGAEVLLFDEPTANVDQRALADFVALVKKLWHNQKLSILITTHNTAMAAALCRKQIFLVEGRLVHQHLLPDGTIAWPGVLHSIHETPALSLPAEALASCLPPGATIPETVLLSGISSFAAGIILRLELLPNQMIEVLVQDKDSVAHARSLTLGSALGIHNGIHNKA